MQGEPSWKAEARALRAQGLTYKQIAARLGKAPSSIGFAINPDSAQRHARQKKAWEEKRREQDRLERERLADVDPAIPGLLPIWSSRHFITEFAMVDIADWEKLREHRFGLISAGYAATRLDGRRVYLHHLIVGHIERGSGLHTDHIDGDKLNNKRRNLRVVSVSENIRNQGGDLKLCWWRQQRAA